MTRRWFFGLLALFLGALLPVTDAHAQTRYWLQVVGDDGEPITSGRCVVLNAGLNTEPTVYTTRSLGTAKSIPITLGTSNGECDWYAALGTTYDVAVHVTGGPYKGNKIRVDGVTQNVHRVVVGRSSAQKVMVTSFTATGSTSQQTASETLPVGALVQDVLVMTKTAVAASTFNVSISGVNSGLRFCSAISTATASGFVDCNPARYLVSTAAGESITYHNQNHASAGYIYVYYKDPGNEP